MVSGCATAGPAHSVADTDAGPADANVPAFDPGKKTQQLSTGITMAYVEAGDPDGEVVIMLHGYTDTSRSFLPTIEALLAGNAQVHIYALDQRGHGDSSMPPAADCAEAPEQCFGLTDFADDALAFMDAGNIAAAHIVGHSMGSLAAQELALAHPDRVESLVLIGSMVFGANNAVLQFLDEQVEGRDASKGQWRGMLEAARPGFRWPQDAYELTPADADPAVRDFMTNLWVTELTVDPAFLEAIVPESTGIRLGTFGQNRTSSSRSRDGRDPCEAESERVHPLSMARHVLPTVCANLPGAAYTAWRTLPHDAACSNRAPLTRETS